MNGGSFSDQYDHAERIPGQPIPIKPAVAEPGVYPLEALSPRIQAAARAIVDKVQLPSSIAANSVLATAALAVQPYIDIELPTREVVPTSLFVVTVAASGDRKSSTDKLANYPVRQRERDLHEAWQRESADYAADSAAYTAARKKASTGNKDRFAIKREIEACGREPLPPPLPMLISDEGTLAGLQKLFADAMPSLGLFSDEGGQWLGGHAMSAENAGQTGAALSKLWDGAPIKRVRAGDVITILRGRRLSLHLMVQHRIAAKLFGDPDLKDQGLLSRVLPCQPITLKGDRPWHDPDVNSDVELTKFQGRVYKLLCDPMPMDPETRELSPRVVKFSDEARALWIQWHDAVEIELKPDGAFDNIAGFAAKLPEHAARLAAVMAYFEDPKITEISARALSAGIKLAKFYVAEALRMIGMGSTDVDNDNAQALIGWIRKKGLPVVGKRWLSLNVVPTSLRPAATLKRAIDVLIEHGHLVPISGGGMMTIGGKDVYSRDAYTVVAEDAE